MSKKKKHKKRNSGSGQARPPAQREVRKKKNHPAPANRETALPRTTGLLQAAGLWWFQAAVLALAVVMACGHTLDVPFYLDDFSSIVENPTIYNWLDIDRLWRFAPLRVVGYFTFALNYHWHQFQVEGYHVVNILIHFLAGCAVLAFGKGIVRTPAMADRIPPGAAKWLPLLAAMLFALHPLQTQAVTYTVQRLASMAALFYIAALACYVHARLAGKNRLKWLQSAAAIMFALLAFFTKQNTITLPLAILIIEMVFFPANRKRLAIITGAMLLGLGAAWAVLGLILHYDPFSLDAMQALTRETTTISRGEYLFTQSKVLWIYLRLFFWPLGLHLDYDVPLAAGFFDWKVIASMTGHLGLLTGALLFLRRFPMAAFAVLFYYLAHLIEWSLIPIRDVCFEHRTYLPNLGLCLGTGWLLAILVTKFKRSYGASLIPVVLVLIMGTMTWQRNQVWRDPILFWQNCTKYSPQKARPWNTLAKHLLNAGENEAAAKALYHAIKPWDAGDHNGIKMNETAAVNLLIVLRRLGRYDEALEKADVFLKQRMNSLNRSKILNNKGNIYFIKKQYPEAETCYRKAVEAYPENLSAVTNLGNVLALRGRISEARKMFLKVLKRDPQHKEARHNLALLGNPQSATSKPQPVTKQSGL